MDISPEIKKLAPVILEEIKKANSILLHCHPLPDPDSVGSVLAMKFALEQMGKKVTAIKGDSDIPEGFSHFPGTESIIEKDFSQIDLADFDLFISIDSGSPEMVSRIHIPVFPLRISTITIDHHVTNTAYGKLNLLDTTSPAAAFVLYQLFNEWNITFNHDIALNLFMGMYTDTGGFKYPPTDYRMFEAAAQLSKHAPDFTDCIFKMENNESKESLLYEALALSSIETFCNDSLAMASVSYDSLVKNHIPEYVIRGNSMSNRLKSVVGWNIGVSLAEKKPKEIKVSFRTRDAKVYDVSKIAAALGGGGHKAAAAAVLEMSLEDAKKAVVAKAKELYNL